MLAVSGKRKLSVNGTGTIFKYQSFGNKPCDISYTTTSSGPLPSNTRMFLMLLRFCRELHIDSRHATVLCFGAVIPVALHILHVVPQ